MHDAPIVKFKLLRDGAVLPRYATDGASGMDACASLSDVVITLHRGARALVPLGVAAEIPHGWELQVRGRSGLALRHGVGMVHGVGTIDSDYRGEINALVVNHGDEPFEIRNGDRIAQLVLARAPQAQIVVVDELSETDRGSNGFGSTGNK